MSKLCIIGIVGHNRSGKSTIANTLSLLGGFLPVGLADGVRSALDDLDGPTWEFRKESDGAGPIARKAMQLMGSEARNAIDRPLIWTELALVKIYYAHQLHAVSRNRFVIPDVRFQHEVDRIASWVEEQDGIYETWIVSRPGFGPTSHHESENSIDKIAPIDQGFRNHKDKQYLITQVEDKILDMQDEYKTDF